MNFASLHICGDLDLLEVSAEAADAGRVTLSIDSRQSDYAHIVLTGSPDELARLLSLVTDAIDAAVAAEVES